MFRSSCSFISSQCSAHFSRDKGLFVHGILVRGRRQSMLFGILCSRVAFTYLHQYAPRLLLLRLLLLWSRSTSGHLGCCTIPNLASTSLLSSHSCRLKQVTYKNLKDFTVIKLNQRPSILYTNHFIFFFPEFNCERTIHPFSYTEKPTFFILILIQLFPTENSVIGVQRKLDMNYQVCFPWKQPFLISPI